MRFGHLIPSLSALYIAFVKAQTPSPTGTAGVMGTAATYPRATILSDGSLLGVYTGGINSASPNTTITIVRSTNQGATWTQVGTVATGPKASTDIDNGYLHQLPSGRILCAFRNHDRSSPTTYSFYRITVSYSDDNGANWNYSSTVTTDSVSGQGDWEPFMMDALDGSLMIFYSHENGPNDQDSMLRRSTDGGLTWSDPPQTISGATVQARDGMVGVTRVAPASPTMIAVFESKDTVNTQLFTIKSVISTDDGANWGNRSTIYDPGAPHNAGAPGVARVGSRLVTSFGTDEDGGTWPTGDMKLVISSNGGGSWGSKTTVHGVPADWTNVLDLDDSTFLAMYETDQTSYAQKYHFS